jgi:hypothetical protein
MQNKKIPHLEQKILLQQQNLRKTKDTHGDVRQDKRAKTSARSASRQPARSDIPMRADVLTKNSPRSQNPINASRPKVPLTLWVEPIVKAEVHRRAAENGVYPSEAGAVLLKKGIQVDLDMQYGALLTPVFENVLKRYMAARDNRLASLLVRACIAIEQTRSIAVNVLGRQPAKSPNVLSSDVLNDILDRSLDDAKKKLTNRSPELKELIKELNSYLLDQERGEK